MNDQYIWFRQHKEPQTSWEGFKLYRGTLHPQAADTPARVAKSHKDARHYPRPEALEIHWKPDEPIREVYKIAAILGKSANAMYRHSSDWKWADRAEAYDIYIDDLSRREMEAAMRLQSIKWRKRLADEPDKILKEVELIRSKVDAIGKEARLWRSEPEEITETYPDGRAKTVWVVVNPAGWQLRDMANMAQCAYDLMQNALRLALGDLSKAAVVQSDESDAIEPEAARVMLEAANKLKGITYEGRRRRA